MNSLGIGLGVTEIRPVTPARTTAVELTDDNGVLFLLDDDGSTLLTE